MDVEAFPFDPTLPHRILFGLTVVLGALQAGIPKGHPDSGRFSPVKLLPMERAWGGQREVPVMSGHRCSPIGLVVNDTK